ncbi:helix-turn-helix domain-containing protein [Mycobacterium branderi]|uniref:DNA-binding protein n=2 Tax=Mycobacterium branderi TaxID=43348 RepID=A0ABN6AWL1_9MYCO|nr:helix-turn-helix domain-containing protein [Mycobacterium branderi]BBZ09830.1 hypothetical protein MBRA_00250 [Mycobacterium branderi]BBZ09902.1 hypothetical protein MBRA_00970 [Mycobacterium branderi]
MKTYSLAEVAAMVLPPEWKDSERWLQRRLRRGLIGGYKVGHTWRMTQDDVDDLIAKHRNTTVRAERPSRQLSFTPTSRRKLRSAS